MTSDAARALDATVVFLRRYVVFANAAQADAVALWCGYTWFYDRWDTAPYLAVQAPARQSGKTRLLECLELIVREALLAGGTSPAALVRIVNAEHPTLIVDEADPLFGKRGDPGSEDLRGLFNNGYRRGKVYLKVVGEGKKMRVEKFDPFGPKALASIGRLPDTIQDRSIVIELKRRLRSEPIARFRFNHAAQEAIPIREWWESLAEQVDLPDRVDVPAQLSDREEDVWEPLLALADAASGEWPARGRRAALLLSGQTEPEDDDRQVLVLRDIRDILAANPVDRISTMTLLDALRGIEESPWRSYRHGEPLSPEGLARLLRPWKLTSRQMKIGGVNVKGYETVWFDEAFRRYLSPVLETPSTVYPSTSERESEHKSRGVEGYDPVEGGETEAGSGSTNGTGEAPTCMDCGDDFPTAQSVVLHHALGQCRAPGASA